MTKSQEQKLKGSRIEVVFSPELEHMKLMRLMGKNGSLTERAKNGAGWYVELDEPYKDETEWFIPIKSIQLTH